MNECRRQLCFQCSNPAAFSTLARRSFSRFSLGLPCVFVPRDSSIESSTTELALAITARGLQALRRSFERASAKCQTGLEKATAIGQAYMDFARNQSDYFKFIARGEVREFGPSPVGENERLCASEGEKTLAVLANAVRCGVADGTIDPGVGDPAAVAVVLWGFIHGMLQVAASKQNMLEKMMHLDIANLLQGGLRLASRAIRAG